MPEYVIILSGFVGIAAVVYLILMYIDPYWFRVGNRLDQLQSDSISSHQDDAATLSQDAPPSPILKLVQRVFPEVDAKGTKLQQRLRQAGISRPNMVARYTVARIAGVLMGALIPPACSMVGLVRMDTALLLACVTAGIGALLPSFWLDRAIARHHLSLHRSLPDFLDLMTVCLEGGMSLQETIRRVGDELQIAHPALAGELYIVQRDMDVGSTVDQALKRFAVRTNYEGVRTLSTFIREAQRFGATITDALRSHADMLRSQREQAAEENAQKASVKILLPTLLLIFPAIFVVAVGPAVIQIQEAFAGQ